MKAGAADFIEKPYSITQLSRKIKTILKEKLQQ
jgi:FixJ family two-component response regulator